MSIAIKALFEPIRRKQFGDIGAAYTAVGNSFENPIRILILQNLTDVMLTFSDDSIDDKIDLASGQSIILDLSANKTIHQGFFIPNNGSLYVKRYSAAPTQGFVSLSVVYASTGL